MCKGIMRYFAFLCALLLLGSVGGVFATWHYARGMMAASQDVLVGINGFIYLPQEMPDGEVTLIERLSDILNQRYRTDIVIDSRDYLINETIQVRWSDYADPYVGSMDKNYAAQIDALFGDVLVDTSVSFILKNQDLNWDGYNEISLYSTSDVLKSSSEWPAGAVCVYLTVFTPVINAQKQVIGYTMVCESLHGYAPEVRYGSNDLMPSFSTDHWRNDIGYMVWNDQTNSSDVFRVPEDAMSHDGTKPFRYDYDSYSQYYQSVWYATTPYGQTARECLDGKIPWLN